MIISFLAGFVVNNNERQQSKFEADFYYGMLEDAMILQKQSKFEAEFYYEMLEISISLQQ
jgi:hypothetical protein